MRRRLVGFRAQSTDSLRTRQAVAPPLRARNTRPARGGAHDPSAVRELLGAHIREVVEEDLEQGGEERGVHEPKPYIRSRRPAVDCTHRDTSMSTSVPAAALVPAVARG